MDEEETAIMGRGASAIVDEGFGIGIGIGIGIGEHSRGWLVASHWLIDRLIV